jgi:hypothetical protein
LAPQVQGIGPGSANPKQRHTTKHDRGVTDDGAQNAAEVVLASQLLAEWNQGRGISKSQIEIRVWNDATSHGRRFDRFIRRALGEATNQPSRQTDRVAQLEAQVRTLGRTPAGAHVGGWEPALQHARSACLAGLRIWNDPTSTFRAGRFALHFVAAWYSLAVAVLERDDRDWRQLNTSGEPRAQARWG